MSLKDYIKDQIISIVVAVVIILLSWLILWIFNLPLFLNDAISFFPHVH